LRIKEISAKFIADFNRKMTMPQYYCEDRGAGERHVYDTLAEALEDAAICLKEYRRSANSDFEWDMSVEDLTVGIVAESGDEDDDIVTHRTRYISDGDEGSFDVTFVEIEQPTAKGTPGT
jgi:hypothetical protein